MLKNLIRYFVSGASYRVDKSISLIVKLRSKHPTIAKIIANRLQKKHGVFISPSAQFDATLNLRHPVAIVIGDGVKLGKNVTIYQSVTIGGARIGDANAGNYPHIGDDTVIFSGAAIIGAVKIGKNCVIGANSVVTKDIPDGCIAAGAPARILRESTHAN